MRGQKGPGRVIEGVSSKMDASGQAARDRLQLGLPESRSGPLSSSFGFQNIFIGRRLS